MCVGVGRPAPITQLKALTAAREGLNRDLLCYAWQNQDGMRGGQTYVGLVGDAVIGYDTLAVGSDQ